MTYGRNKPLTAEMNEKHKKTALWVFITGLNGHIYIFYESTRLTERYGNSTRTRRPNSRIILHQIYSGTKTQIKIPGKVTIKTIIAIRGILTTWGLTNKRAKIETIIVRIKIIIGIKADSLILNIIPIVNGVPIMLNKTSQNRWK